MRKFILCLSLFLLIPVLTFSKTYSIYIHIVGLNGNTMLHRVYKHVEFEKFRLVNGFLFLFDEKDRERIYGGGFFIEIEEEVYKK